MAKTDLSLVQQVRNGKYSYGGLTFEKKTLQFVIH